MDESFRSLTAKEMRRQNERRSGEEGQREKKKRHNDSCDEDRDASDDGVRRKRYDDGRYPDRKHDRRRNREEHSDSRLKDDKRVARGRGDDFEKMGRNSGSGHARGMSPDRYSNRDGEDRDDRHHKQNDSKQYGNVRRPYERDQDSRRNRSARNYSPEGSSSSSSDRPAWATKAVMKRAEEIQKRKLIWSKPEEKKESIADPPTSSATATWNSILAASSSDSKQLDKFKRLMGMKKSDEQGQEEAQKVDDTQVEAERKRQRDLYSHLDQQYAVARSFTHLSRGQGLGFHQ